MAVGVSPAGRDGAGGIGGLSSALDPRATVKNTQSLGLNGVNQYFVVPQAPAISFGGESFTIEGYVKLSARTSPYPAQFLAFKKPLNQADSKTDYAFLVQAGSGIGGWGTTGRELALMLGDGVNNVQTVVSTLQITDTSWHYVSVAYDTSTRAVRFILDGNTQTQIAAQQTYSPNTGDLVVGVYHNASGQYAHYLSGLLDEVRISRGVVATDQLLRADPPQYPTPAVVEGWWRCEDKGTTIADSSGNGLDGTAVGAPTHSTDFVMDDFALPRRYVVEYDGNGNVGQLVNATPGADYGTLAARYEYDPYGNLTVMAGPYAVSFPFRFSTKYYEEIGPGNSCANGMYDYGYRFYSPWLGRWMNRDRRAERGGNNLYGFVRSNPLKFIDPHGLAGVDCNQIGDIATMRSPELKNSEDSRYIYTCGCGWIDREHLLNSMKAYGIIKKDLEGSSRKVTDGNQQIENLSAPRYVIQSRVWILDWSTKCNYWVNWEMVSDVSRIAAAIAFDTANQQEADQNILFKGYDQEDLPSNAIGVRMAMDGITDLASRAAKGWLENKCGPVLSWSAAKEICDCCKHTGGKPKSSGAYWNAEPDRAPDDCPSVGRHCKGAKEAAIFDPITDFGFLRPAPSPGSPTGTHIRDQPLWYGEEGTCYLLINP